MRYLVYGVGILVGAGGMWLLLHAGKAATLFLICLVATVATVVQGSTNLAASAIWTWVYYGITGAATVAVGYDFLTRPSKTLLGHSWMVWSAAERANVLMLVMLVLCSTMVSMIAARPAAGGALLVFNMFIALSGSWTSTCRRKGGKLRLLQPLILVNAWMVVVLVGLWLSPLEGSTGDLLNSPAGTVAGFSVAVLGGALFFGGQRRQMRLAGFILGAIAFVELVIQASSASSLIVGVLVSWAVCAMSSLAHSRAATWSTRGKRVLATVMTMIIVLTCVIPPITTYTLYSAWLNSGKTADAIAWALTETGETEWNLFNRPARWSVLLGRIASHPVNLMLTNFEDSVYEEIPGVWQSAQPHNVLIAFGVWWGWLGLLVVVLSIWLFFRRAATCVLLASAGDRVVALWSIGVTAGLLFRNMWSTGVLVFPLETLIFASGVCLIGMIDTRKGSSIDSMVEIHQSAV